VIHTLKSQRDGGILDLDDLLADVVDDKEQVGFRITTPRPARDVAVNHQTSLHPQRR